LIVDDFDQIFILDHGHHQTLVCDIERDVS